MRERLARLVVAFCLVVLLGLSTLFARAQNPPSAPGPAPADRAAGAEADSLRGLAVYEARGCARCHSVAGLGNERNPLDGVAARRTRDELEAWTVGADALEDSLPPSAFRAKRAYQSLPTDSLGWLLDYLSQLGPGPGAQVGAVLDDFHRAASEADFVGYFGHFARGGVFLGTDPAERWTVAEFQAYARPYFDAGRGWTYRPTVRNIVVGPGEQVAWFDELLHNATYGTTRGSGVLVREDGRWRIALYDLSIPVPNALARSVVELIAGGDQER
jgi:mono/diheme cytochrome c family protein